MDYPFIAITPRSTLIRGDNTCCAVMVLNRHSYNHVLKGVNGRIVMSIVAVGPCCDPSVRNVNEHIKLCLSSSHKNSLQFVSKNWEKEREYESCVDRVSWAKRNNMRRIVCSFCSNMFVRSFCLHGFASGVWPLFAAHFKIESRNFSLVFTSSWLGFNSLFLLRRVF